MTGPGPTRQAHQVLATLGYGDAIANAVLGIQRVLRAAGFRSDIFTETAIGASRSWRATTSSSPRSALRTPC